MKTIKNLFGYIEVVATLAAFLGFILALMVVLTMPIWFIIFVIQMIT